MKQGRVRVEGFCDLLIESFSQVYRYRSVLRTFKSSLDMCMRFFSTSSIMASFDITSWYSSTSPWSATVSATTSSRSIRYHKMCISDAIYNARWIYIPLDVARCLPFEIWVVSNNCRSECTICPVHLLTRNNFWAHWVIHVNDRSISYDISLTFHRLHLQMDVRRIKFRRIAFESFDEAIYNPCTTPYIDICGAVSALNTECK